MPFQISVFTMMMTAVRHHDYFEINNQEKTSNITIVQFLFIIRNEIIKKKKTKQKNYGMFQQTFTHFFISKFISYHHIQMK